MTFVCLIYLVSQFTSYLFLSLFNAAGDHFEKPGTITGSPSSKYEHRYCCITFELTRFVGGEKPIVSVTYQYERISTEKKRKKEKKRKNGLPYLKCVLGGVWSSKSDQWRFKLWRRGHWRWKLIKEPNLKHLKNANVHFNWCDYLLI